MYNKRGRLNKNIYYKKSNKTNIYLYTDKRKIVINIGNTNKSSSTRFFIPLFKIGLMILSLAWQLGITAFVKTNWDTIEPLVEMLDWIIRFLTLIILGRK